MSRRNRSRNKSNSPQAATYYEVGSKKKGIFDRIADFLLGIVDKFIDLTFFLTRGRGKAFWGIPIFFWGLFISADAYWQARYPQYPALTWFGNWENFYGAWNTFRLLFTSLRSPLLETIAISTIVQIAEGFVIWENTPEKAKKTADYYSQFKSGEEPKDSIHAAKVAHSNYKRAGLGRVIFSGFIGLGCWVVDIVVTLQEENPFVHWGNPGAFLTSLGIVAVKVLAAEASFVLMLRLAGK